MKVLDIYSKKDLDMLTCDGRLIREIMDSHFMKFPDSYRENYDKNISGLEIWRVDETPDKDAGIYLPKSNLLLFKKFSALPHELQHLASYDSKSKKMAFIKSFDFPLYEVALMEGFAEFLSAQSLGKEVEDSFFECFTVSMLSSIDGIFESFYIPNYEKFISLFPNKKDIYSLMYSLDYYRDTMDNLEKCNEGDMVKLIQAIKDTIDTLIDIELSFKKGMRVGKTYGDKFMDEISSYDLSGFVGDVYSDYKDYAFHEIKRRVLGRKK